MRKGKKPVRYKLTPGELEILELLWTEGNANLGKTVQWFQQRGRNLAPTTLHTRLNRLVEKKLIRRIAENPAVYEASISRNDVSGRYFELFEELCGHNFIPLIAQLAEKRNFTDMEVEYLEQILAAQKQNEVHK